MVVGLAGDSGRLAQKHVAVERKAVLVNVPTLPQPMEVESALGRDDEQKHATLELVQVSKFFLLSVHL